MSRFPMQLPPTSPWTYNPIPRCVCNRTVIPSILPRTPHFYRAMLCIRGTSHGPVSVRLSVTSRRSTKTAKRRITQTTPHDTPGLSFAGAKDLREIRPGSPPTGAPNAGGVGQNRRLSTNNRLISKTVKDRHMVSIKLE